MSVFSWLPVVCFLTQYDKGDGCDGVELFGTVTCRADLEGSVPEISLTLVQADARMAEPLDHVIYHPFVQSAEPQGNFLKGSCCQNCMWNSLVNLLAPERCSCNSKRVIFKHISRIDIWYQKLPLKSCLQVNALAPLWWWAFTKETPYLLSLVSCGVYTGLSKIAPHRRKISPYFGMCCCLLIADLCPTKMEHFKQCTLLHSLLYPPTGQNLDSPVFLVNIF